MELKARHFKAEGFLIMDKTIVAKVSLIIDAIPSKVWDALVKPQLVQESGVEAISDWQVGSLISYKGTGTNSGYEDTGKVLQVEPGRFLVCTWFNSTDMYAENARIVRYDLSAAGKGTRLIITFIEAADAGRKADYLGQSRRALQTEMEQLIASLDHMHF